VQRAAQKAGTLEELDRILATPDIRISPERTDSNPPDGRFDRALLDQAERLLGVYLGPIARLLVRQAAGRASDTASLGQLLAAELANDREKQAFLAAFEQQPS
jgi:serine/threonine-protein kinase